jgi:site-specific DNA-cytosine methylase
LFSEIESFAIANLVAKMEAGLLDAAPVWTNLKTLPWDGFLGKVDIISGGFPCQPFSSAGKRNGDEDPRHLFPYILDGIGRCRPSVVFLENVEGILSAKLNGEGWRDPAGTPVLLHVLRELERVDYKATAGIFSASEVGAPHQRKRVFIMAQRKDERFQFWKTERWSFSNRSEWPAIRDQPIGQGGVSGEELAHREGFGIQGHGAGWLKESHSYVGEGIPMCGGVGLADTMCYGSGESREVQQRPDGAIPISNGESRGTWPSRPGQPQYEWEPPRVVANYPKTWAGGGLDDTKNSNDQRWQSTMGERGANIRWDYQVDTVTQQYRGTDCSPREYTQCETKPSLGGNPNGPSRGVGHAELYVSCDNRTDELRLLGNGVVPATAELAFRTLWEELIP